MSSEEAPAPLPYRVSYSQHARNELRALLERAEAAGRGPEYFQAAREIDSRLRIYPQFGEPLIDLTQERGQIYVGIVAPLVVRYVIYEDLRQVMVANPIRELRRSAP